MNKRSVIKELESLVSEGETIVLPTKWRPQDVVGAGKAEFFYAFYAADAAFDGDFGAEFDICVCRVGLNKALICTGAFFKISFYALLAVSVKVRSGDNI